jgi:hypothetical protein
VRGATTLLNTPLADAAWKWSEYARHRWYSRRLRKRATRYARANDYRVEVALVLSVGNSIMESAR